MNLNSNVIDRNVYSGSDLTDDLFYHGETSKDFVIFICFSLMFVTNGRWRYY